MDASPTPKLSPKQTGLSSTPDKVPIITLTPEPESPIPMNSSPTGVISKHVTHHDLCRLPISPIPNRLLAPSVSPDLLSQSYTFGSSTPASAEVPSVFSKIRGGEVDLNATYPAPRMSRMQVNGARGLRRLQGHGMDTISFSPMHGLSTSQVDGLSVSRNDWGFKSMIGRPGISKAPAPGPVKSLLTIDADGQILVANQKACDLFGYKPWEITKETLSKLIPKNRSRPKETIPDLQINEDGTVETVNGRVLEAKHRDGHMFPVSVHITKLDTDEGRYMAAMEAVTRESALVALSESGNVIWCEQSLLKIYMLDLDDVIGKPLTNIIPSIQLSRAKNLQHVITKGSQSIVIPASLQLSAPTPELLQTTVISSDEKINSTEIFEFATIHVYRSISGLITCTEDGLISSFNATFVLLLFGYTENQLKNQPIQKLLPDIATGPEGFSQISVTNLDQSMSQGPSRGKHRDGLIFGVTWHMKKIVDKDMRWYYCLWISHDPSTDTELSEGPTPDANEEQSEVISGIQAFTAGEFSKNYIITEALGTGSFGTVAKAQPRAPNVGNQVVVKCIVKSKVLSECWDSPPKEDWARALNEAVDPSVREQLPREIVLLMRLDHDNIIKAIQVFHNEEHFQLVLQFNGESFDLFNFVEENMANGDDRMIAHIFEQVASAVAYLHDSNIVHRDIKDENVVLDHRLHARLIDFGSAHYIREGSLFDTFCGTLEYCAPEVLLGTPYAGPELDMFALGVTLYTVIFGERPFFDVEETIAGVLYPPFAVDENCSNLLLWILDCDPVERATAHEFLTHEWITQTPPWTGQLENKRRTSSPPQSEGTFKPESDDEDEDLDDELSATYDRLASM